MVVISASLVLVLALALVYLLVRAVDHRSLSSENITYLLLANALVAAFLLAAIVGIAWRLRVRLREGRFGSRLLLKLAAIFALIGIVPGALIYSVSYQFVSRSIESWFDVHVEAALEAGLNLGRATLDNLSNDLSSKVRAQVHTLEFGPEIGLSVSLDRLREQVGADDAQVWTHSGHLLASSGASKFQLSPDKPTAAQWRSLKSQRSISIFEGLDDASKGTTSATSSTASAASSAKLKIIVPIGAVGLGLQSEQRYLQISQRLPASLVSNSLAVQRAYSEYQERSLARLGLQKMYIGTLTLSLFLAVLGAFILAVILGNQLVRPLLLLAQGVERVSQGDLSPKLVMQDNNELAGLTRSFASMTQQLADARAQEQKTERVKAWNEIAQRVAHEIKNPLTPIQLSAERMAMKLSDKLQGADAALLHKSVSTIVAQVEAMKRLVNEFRDYARLPSAQLQAVSLQTVIEDTLHLYEHEVQTGCIQLSVMADCPMINGDAQQLRQVVHNVLQNALDAANAQSTKLGVAACIRIELSLGSGVDLAEHLVCTIEDNGSGFAPHILEHAFEPYNTTKPKGTGLGLALVRKIILEHAGHISLTNLTSKAELTDETHSAIAGAQVRLLFPLIKKDAGAFAG
jgi:nitrogen fixation/metabolism regulation signal transduction histidine kinase